MKRLKTALVLFCIIILACGCSSTGQTEKTQNPQNTVMSMPFYGDIKGIYYYMLDGEYEESLYRWLLKRYDLQTGTIETIIDSDESQKFSIEDDQLYYIKQAELYKHDLHTKNEEKLIIDQTYIPYLLPTIFLQSIHQNVYFFIGDIEKIRSDNSEILIKDATAMNIYGNKIYYADKEKNIHQTNMSGKQDKIIMSGSKFAEVDKLGEDILTNIIKIENKIYFLGKVNESIGKIYCYDMEQNKIFLVDESPYYEFQILDNKVIGIAMNETNEHRALIEYNMDTGKRKILDDIAMGFCIQDNKIYFMSQIKYQTGDNLKNQELYGYDRTELSLYSINLDGSNKQLIDKGIWVGA